MINLDLLPMLRLGDDPHDRGGIQAPCTGREGAVLSYAGPRVRRHGQALPIIDLLTSLPAPGGNHQAAPAHYFGPSAVACNSAL